MPGSIPSPWVSTAAACAPPQPSVLTDDGKPRLDLIQFPARSTESPTVFLLDDSRAKKQTRYTRSARAQSPEQADSQPGSMPWVPTTTWGQFRVSAGVMTEARSSLLLEEDKLSHQASLSKNLQGSQPLASVSGAPSATSLSLGGGSNLQNFLSDSVYHRFPFQSSPHWPLLP